ncbi:MAG: M23 family metallopeptidase [Candidatus Magnetomorum sp.]|nr:M23 family metallopeptidase [Candidatus Magnetomorum sp.]
MGLVGVVFLCLGAWALILRFEGESPSIQVLDCPKFFGLNTKISIQASDQKSGLRKIWVAFFIDGKEKILYENNFSINFWKGKSLEQKHAIDISFEPKKDFFPDGDGLLRIAVWDHSWRSFFKGNNAYLEKTITIDTQPPKIEVISRKHHFNQGGAGLVIYRVSEKDTVNGVQVGEHFFSGMSGLFKDPLVYTTFLGVAHDQGPGTEMFIRAEDQAHNLERAPFTYNIRKKRFKQDIIRITDRFLRKKLPELRPESDTEKTLLDRFLAVNREERLANFKTIQTVCQTTKNVLFWKDTFLRLPKSATRSGFGDRRTYRYQEKVVDHQVHLGIDLASTYHSPVPAANYGQVIFAEELGIYGRVVIIDHGFGLFSLYSHLSRFSCEPGKTVNKGDIIGHTGTTGLAGGDHLHLSILVQGVFTNPLEWWDKNWIQYNITDKIESARQLIKDGL